MPIYGVYWLQSSKEWHLHISLYIVVSCCELANTVIANTVNQLLCNRVRNFLLCVCLSVSVCLLPAQIGKPIHRYDITPENMPKYGAKPTHRYDITPDNIPKYGVKPTHRYINQHAQACLYFEQGCVCHQHMLIYWVISCKVAKNDITVTSHNVCLWAYRFAQATDTQTHGRTDGRTEISNSIT